jgi:hypothetical protein
LVEQTIGWLETWLLGKIRNQKFFSFHELNAAIKECLAELSKRPFQKRSGSRWSDFQKIDSPALRPLPAQRYEIADIVSRRVGDNYHLEYADFYYSTPYTLHGERVTLRATVGAVEILDKNHIRIASHKRRYTAVHGRYVTDVAHMPPNHKIVYASRKFDGGRYRTWARNIGESTLIVIDCLLTGGAVEEQGYKACMGILQFSEKYGGDALEEACTRARTIGSCTYTTVKNILKSGYADNGQTDPLSTPSHGNIRGGGYYR